MIDPKPLAAGSLLVLIGLAMVVMHLRTRKRELLDTEMDDATRKHLAARFRRRMQASGMIAIIGILIPVGDWLPALRKQPGWFGLYWLCVLLLTFWVLLLAMGDYVATRAHGRAGLARLRKKQLDLEKEIAEIRRRESKGQNGKH